MHELEILRRELALVKEANPMAKLAPAERFMEEVARCITRIDFRLTQLERKASNG